MASGSVARRQWRTSGQRRAADPSELAGRRTWLGPSGDQPGLTLPTAPRCQHRGHVSIEDARRLTRLRIATTIFEKLTNLIEEARQA